MADAKILQLSAAASRRRSFAASQKKGAAAPDKPADGAPPSPAAPGPVAGLSGLNKPAAPPHASVGPNGGPSSPAPAAPHPYVQHAAALSGIAQQQGAPQLASAIRAVASVPHPADKVQVARNYLASQPPQVAQQHAHMFTQTLMGGPQ